MGLPAEGGRQRRDGCPALGREQLDQPRLLGPRAEGRSLSCAGFGAAVAARARLDADCRAAIGGNGKRHTTAVLSLAPGRLPDLDGDLLQETALQQAVDRPGPDGTLEATRRQGDDQPPDLAVEALLERPGDGIDVPIVQVAIARRHGPEGPLDEA
jgi:hypothetical protein